MRKATFPVPKLRRATLEDCDEIAALLRLAFDTAMPFLPVLHTADEDRAFIRERVLPSCEIWIGQDKTILGFIAFRDGWIDQLYVHPQHQRHGLGRALLEQAKARFAPLQLWVFQRNTNAISFYEKNGFKKLRETDGAENQEREPDVLFGWP